MKKVIQTLFSILGICAIGLCTAMAIKTPNVYKDLFGIKDDKDTIIQGVPYFVNFGDLGTSDSSYKTQYFKYANRSWYLSWGNHGQQKDHVAQDGSTINSFNMLLGWNATKHPVYGSYSYINEVMQEIKVDEKYNFSYLIMDFDFNLNHYMEWSFSSFEDLTKSDTKLYLISSHNQGSSWSIIDKKENVAELIKDNELKFVYTEDSLMSRTSRYGLVLVSNATSARIELNQFIVQRLSVV